MFQPLSRSINDSTPQNSQSITNKDDLNFHTHPKKWFKIKHHAREPHQRILHNFNEYSHCLLNAHSVDYGIFSYIKFYTAFKISSKNGEKQMNFFYSVLIAWWVYMAESGSIEYVLCILMNHITVSYPRHINRHKLFL